MSARHPVDAPWFLVGFMGVGKSTAGAAVASRWGWDFADTDALVEEAAGRSIETIFRESGEGRFRAAEWDALQSIAGRRRVVVATGGGLFLGTVQRAFVRAHGVSCWLDAPLSVVTARVGDLSARPLWPAGDALSRRTFFERRRAAYALADVRVAASASNVGRVVDAIEAARDALLR